MMCCAGTFRPQAHQDVIRLLELSLQAFRLVLGLDILWRLRILSLEGAIRMVMVMVMLMMLRMIKMAYSALQTCRGQKFAV